MRREVKGGVKSCCRFEKTTFFRCHLIWRKFSQKIWGTFRHRADTRRPVIRKRHHIICTCPVVNK